MTVRPCPSCGEDVLHAALTQFVEDQNPTTCVSLACPSCKTPLWLSVVSRSPLILGEAEPILVMQVPDHDALDHILEKPLITPAA